MGSVVTVQEWTFRVLEYQVVDGDSYRLRLDLGFRLTTIQPARLRGADCPEKHQGSPYERHQARLAETTARAWFLDSPTVWVRTYRDPDSFGRWLVDVMRDDGEQLADALVAAGLAVWSPFPQRGSRWWQIHDPNRDRTVEQ